MNPGSQHAPRRIQFPVVHVSFPESTAVSWGALIFLWSPHHSKVCPFPHKLSCQTLPLRLFRAVCGAFRHGSLLGVKSSVQLSTYRYTYVYCGNEASSPHKLSCQTLPLRLFQAVCGAFRRGSLLGAKRSVQLSTSRYPYDVLRWWSIFPPWYCPTLQQLGNIYHITTSL